MDGFDFGHGFLPRVAQANHRALERALGPQSLFDPEPASLPWVMLRGTADLVAPELDVTGSRRTRVASGTSHRDERQHCTP